MKEYSFYSETTGEFHNTTIGTNSADPRVLKSVLDRLPGYAAIEGKFDHLSQRVDLKTKLVVDYQPPAPSADHEWNVTTMRWQLNAAAQAKRDARADALRQIEQFERSQARPLREHALGVAGALERLQAIDDQISELRKRL